MKKFLVIGLIAAAIAFGCLSQPTAHQPPAPENATNQACITFGPDTAYCVRSEKAPHGTTKYELTTK